jgi:hypothetical protein
VRYSFKIIMLLNTFAECSFAPYIDERRQLQLHFGLAGTNIDCYGMQLTVLGFCLFKKGNYAKHIKHTISCNSVRITFR